MVVALANHALRLDGKGNSRFDLDRRPSDAETTASPASIDHLTRSIKQEVSRASEQLLIAPLDDKERLVVVDREISFTPGALHRAGRQVGLRLLDRDAAANVVGSAHPAGT